MVESSNFLLFLVVIVIGVLIFEYRHYTFKKKIGKQTEMVDVLPTDKMPNEDEFIYTIAENHDTYDEFIRSSDFDNYFQYWKTHPKSVEKVKELIESKNNKSFFKYKNIKY